MTPANQQPAPTVATAANLLDRLLARVGGNRRVILGICGPPGAGKSTLAAFVADQLGDRCVLVPMDGFHLAQVELERLGRAHRKGAIDTFDAAGYVALMQRLVARTEPVVYAPTFRRDLEEPIAGAIAVPTAADVVITEGNYLLSDTDPWSRLPTLLDETWFVTPEENVRHSWLIERHIRFGRDPAAATAWAMGTDEHNAQLVLATAHRADLVVRLADTLPHS
jgi:pantothenate kinase